MGRLATIFLVLAALSVAPQTAASAPALPGVPTDASLLFALESRAGTLVPDTRSGESRYTLTLRGVRRRATWFTDRPHRNAGRVDTRKLFTAWRELGFRADPPNAALVVDRAKANRDTVAAEIRLRSYDKRRRTARFAVRTLGSLGGGLRHINRRLDRRPPRRFGPASLFIDNATLASGDGCTLGQPQLFAFPSNKRVQPMLAANGQTLSIRKNLALFQVLGAQFGGDGINTFALPDMEAPPNMGWFICVYGVFPEGDDLGNCVPGEVDYWIYPGVTSDPDLLPADGRTAPISQYQAYESVAPATGLALQLPNVPAPPGMQALVCMDTDSDSEGLPPVPSMGQVDLFTGTPFVQGELWMPTRGQQLSKLHNQGLYYLITPPPLSPGGDFELPALEAPAAGVEYYIATFGAWPLDS